MSGAIWNKTRSLADVWFETPFKRAMRRRVERNLQELRYKAIEDVQLDDQPAPGRVPYAGREDEPTGD